MYSCVPLVVLAVLPIVHLKVLDEDMLLYWRRTEHNPMCKPFSTYQENCNRCVCSADGIPYCTKMACFKSKQDEVDSNFVPVARERQEDQEA